MQYAISIWPEWVWAIQNLGKNIENRTWDIPKNIQGRRVAIHASKEIGGGHGKDFRYKSMRNMAVKASYCGYGFDSCVIDNEMSYRFIKGKSDIDFFSLEGIVFEEGKLIKSAIVAVATFTTDKDLSNNWRDEGLYNWKLTQIYNLVHPVPCKGSQRFWKIPEEIEKKIIKEYPFNPFIGVNDTLKVINNYFDAGLQKGSSI